MKATIWHNPACGTSRNTLALLEERGAEVEVIEYLKHPPSREKLAQLYRDAGMAPSEGLRRRGTDAEERGLPQAAPDRCSRCDGSRSAVDRAPAGRDRKRRAAVPSEGARRGNPLG